ncbi:MAG TPA: hypothetical protein VIJ70_11655 [Gaiellaceae bacterium]
MGLKDLLQRWTKSRDANALAKAEAESQMTPAERDVDQEDFEARKDDTLMKRSYAASEAEDVAEGELED